MEVTFCGNWENNGRKIIIQQQEKTFFCSLSQKNIGIIFNNDLIVSEFDDGAQSGGIGVYSPIGDGYSNYALWSSTGIIGQLGSGIALKSDESLGFDGEYNVRYYVGNRDGDSFIVRIGRVGNGSIYKLSWFKENKNTLHGIGFMIENSLAFAWGSIDHKYNFNRFHFCIDNGTEKLIRQTIKWNATKIESNDYIRV